MGADDVKGVELVLGPGAELSGVVRDHDGAPLAGALVAADVRETDRPTLFERPWPVARSGRDGAFKLRGLPGGSAALRAQLPGRDDARSPRFALAPGQQRSLDLRFDARRDSYVEGTVARPGAAIPQGARVVAGWTEDTGFGVHHALIAADGRFRIGPLPPGRIMLVATLRPAGALVIASGAPHQTEVTIEEGKSVTGVSLRLPRESLAVAGRVLSPDGSPLEGAHVTAEPNIDGEQWLFGEATPETRADADGRFVLPNLEPGSYTVRVVFAGYVPYRAEVAAAKGRPLEVKLTRGGRVRGEVTDVDARPAARFSLRALSRDVASDERAPMQEVHDPRGRFELSALAPGSYQIEAVTDDGRVARSGLVRVAPDQVTDVHLRLERGGKLELRVVDLESGQPLPASEITVEDGGQILARARSDAGGRALVQGLPRVRGLVIRVSAPGGGHIAERIKTAGTAIPGGAAGPIEVRLARRDPERWRVGVAPGTVGMGIDREGHQLLITQVMPDGAAARAGVTAGAEIVAVDGRAVEGCGPHAVVDLIRGAPGSPVTLGLRTASGTRQVTLTRGAR